MGIGEWGIGGREHEGAEGDRGMIRLERWNRRFIGGAILSNDEISGYLPQDTHHGLLCSVATQGGGGGKGEQDVYGFGLS